MTFKEAYESGKRFKRISWGSYWSDFKINNNISVEDAVAVDWEIEEEKKKVEYFGWRDKRNGQVYIYPKDQSVDYSIVERVHMLTYIEEI